MTIVHLAWNASPDPTVAGYMIHAGQRSGVYSITQDVGNVLDAAIDLPTLGRWFTAIGAYNAAQQEAVGAELAMYVAPANVVISPYVPNSFRVRLGAPPAPVSPFVNSERTSFFLRHEMYGAGGYTYPEASLNLSNGLANMMAFHPPIDAGMNSFFAARPTAGFEFFRSAATKINSESTATLAAHHTAAATLCASQGQARSLWAMMIEWDQSGGAWHPTGRPSYAGMTRPQAYARFVQRYMVESPPLETYLNMTSAQRACRFGSIADYGPGTFIAAQMGLGADILSLERAIDELGDTSTGIAFARGAGRLYDKPWGIDISTWRTSADSGTSFNSSGLHTGGWTPSYLRRHMYIAYMGGAHLLQIEPTVYFLSGTTYNPFGTMVDAFGDFALTRHPLTTIGPSVVPLALMFDYYSGFDTKHGPFNQYDAVWYGDIPYSSGDYMINNFFKVAYPNHWLHGQTPGAPFGNPANTAQFQSFLAAGGDARPYEPMPTTRWGDTMDITLNTASATLLGGYRIVALMGGVVIDPTLRIALQTFAQAGGTVVINTEQATAADQSLLGVTLGGTAVSGGTSTWTPTGETFTEAAYTYRPVTLTTATVLATTGAAPLITQNVVGSGRVILTTPLFLQNTARSALTAIGVKLFDELMKGVLPVMVTGPPVEFMINSGPGRLITTLINSVAAGTTWNGTIAAPIAGTVTAAKEWIGDTNIAYTNVGGVVTLSVSVPAFDVKVYAIDYV
jgi:hypothetical protein